MNEDQDESCLGRTAGYLIITLLSRSKLNFYVHFTTLEKMLKTGQNLSKIGCFLSKSSKLGYSSYQSSVGIQRLILPDLTSEGLCLKSQADRRHQ